MSNSRSSKSTITNRSILAIAVPVMLSNVSTPLIGIVDTGVVGRIPDPAYIGAVAVGALIFTFVFWAFGFLRMGTTGLTAQALGAEDNDEIIAGLGRALLVALIAGLGLIALQWPIREIAFRWIGSSPQVEELARGYFNIRIWAAPATLANYALLGWFVGLGRTRTGLLLQLVLNLTNMALDALFVLGLGWGVEGVATGTVIAEMIAVIAGLFIASRHTHHFGGRFCFQRILQIDRLRRTLIVNGDIMIRSLALIFVFVWFMARGARQGDVILAANAVLMHFISTGAFFLDGLAFATEALVGRAIGAKNSESLSRSVRLTTLWAAATAVVISATILTLGPVFADMLSVDPEVRSTVRIYLFWAAGSPLLGVWAFQLDGIFIGATLSAEMRNAMLVSLAIFLVAWWTLQPYGNHGLWAALYANYCARTVTLWYYYPALSRTMGR